MKKIFSLILLSSLIIPALSYALTEGASRAAGRPMATGTPKQTREEVKQYMQRNASSTRPRMASSTREMGFCAQIDKILVQVGNGGLTSGTKRVENGQARDEKRQEVRAEVDARREENNTKRKSQLEELTRRASTTEQKAALTAFTTAIDKALAIKKSSTDALLAAHRKEVDQTVASRKAAMDKALVTLTADIDAAKAKAKTDCKGGVTGETVRSTLKDSIQKAQQTFRTTMQSLPKNTETPKQDVKKQELKTIEETYRKSVEQAKNNLKAAFKVKEVGTASTTAN